LCNGDFSCDGDVDGTDAFQFKSDFGRSNILNPCPSCPAGINWCVDFANKDWDGYDVYNSNNPYDTDGYPADCNVQMTALTQEPLKFLITIRMTIVIQLPLTLQKQRYYRPGRWYY